jgi:hypothetical protein
MSKTGVNTLMETITVKSMKNVLLSARNLIPGIVSFTTRMQ